MLAATQEGATEALMYGEVHESTLVIPGIAVREILVEHLSNGRLGYYSFSLAS